jgi:hypothetical protein
MTQFNPTVIKPAKIVGDRTESGTVTDSTTRTLSGSLTYSGIAPVQASPTAIDGDGGDTQAATITAVALFSGAVNYDCGGGASTGTTDTAANIVSAAFDAVGQSFRCVVTNTSDAAESLTLAFGSGVTATNLGADLVLTQGEAAILEFVATNVTASSEAVRCIVIKD